MRYISKTVSIGLILSVILGVMGTFFNIGFDAYIGNEHIGIVKGYEETHAIINEVSRDINVQIEEPSLYMKFVLKDDYTKKEDVILRLKELFEIKHKVAIVASREDPVTVEHKQESKFVWAIKGEISSPFGERWGKTHEGIDIAANLGDNIIAAASGVVTFSGWQTGYGKIIVIDNGEGFETYYAHCSELLASSGDFVDKGEVIALVGNTGVSTGPHLHFEIRKDGIPQNPLEYLQGV